VERFSPGKSKTEPQVPVVEQSASVAKDG